MARSAASLSLEQSMRGASEYPRPAYACYVVFVLMLAYILSFIDRTILTLLVDVIRRDLRISDTQISLLHGFAFAIFYTLLGVPLGRLADRAQRVRIISIGIVIWSAMTALCGVAKNFWQLFAFRMGVGAGEAALSPAAYSIITDSFPPEQRSRALSAYVLAAYFGMGIAYMIGGVVVKAIEGMPGAELPIVGHIYPWQYAFLLVGLPGLLFVLLMRTVKEPARKAKLVSGAASARVSLREVASHLFRRKRTYLSHFIGFGFVTLLINGAALWTPTFMQRTYGWTTYDAGIAYGLIIMVFGSAGVLFGGWIADRLHQRGKLGGAYISAIIGASACLLPCFTATLMPSASLALLVMVPLIFFGAMPFGVAVSAISQITPNEMRGLVSALYLFCVNLLGIGLGPILIALVTDFYFADESMLRYSMSIVLGAVAILSVAVLWYGLPSYRRDEAEALSTFQRSPG